MSYTVVLYCFTFVTNLIIIIIIINCKVYLLVTDLERGVFLKKITPRYEYFIPRGNVFVEYYD